MKNVIGYITALSFLFLQAHIVSPVYAQGVGPQFCTENGAQGIQTGIGCIPAAPGPFVGKLFTLSIGIAGGIAFLLIVLGGLQIQTSTGNPEKLTQGREIIEGAIIGLLLIVLAIFILRIVGIDILHIPFFKK